jgi:hypothetical protein
MAVIVYNHYFKEDMFQGKFSHCQYITIIKVFAGKSLVIRVSNDAIVKERHFQGSCTLCKFIFISFVFVCFCLFELAIPYLVLERPI